MEQNIVFIELDEKIVKKLEESLADLSDDEMKHTIKQLKQSIAKKEVELFIKTLPLQLIRGCARGSINPLGITISGLGISALLGKLLTNSATAGVGVTAALLAGVSYLALRAEPRIIKEKIRLDTELSLRELCMERRIARQNKPIPKNNQNVKG